MFMPLMSALAPSARARLSAQLVPLVAALWFASACGDDDGNDGTQTTGDATFPSTTVGGDDDGAPTTTGGNTGGTTSTGGVTDGTTCAAIPCDDGTTTDGGGSVDAGTDTAGSDTAGSSETDGTTDTAGTGSTTATTTDDGDDGDTTGTGATTGTTGATETTDTSGAGDTTDGSGTAGTTETTGPTDTSDPCEPPCDTTGATDTGDTTDTTDTGPTGPVEAPFGLDARPSNATCVAPSRPTDTAPVKFVDAFPGLKFTTPVKILQAPGDPSRWYVLERAFGANEVVTSVKTFPAGATAQTDVTDFVRVSVFPSGEGGLLGMAFHPDFANNGHVFLSYTRVNMAGDPAQPTGEPLSPNMTSVLTRFTSTDGGVTAGAKLEIFARRQPFLNHNGGNIEFGPDGYLYFGLGDGGSGDDPLNAGQQLNTLLGKMLRLDVDNVPTGETYGIPADNPFVNSRNGERPEIFAWGLRNPWRWSFDRATGDLWLGDVGQGAWEEIDLIERGGNYGWKLCEGFHVRGSTTTLCSAPGAINPIAAHGRSEAKSIVGGYVYRGTEIPELVGTYIYGDYVTGNIFRLKLLPSGQVVPEIIGNVGASQLVSFGEGADGELYLTYVASGAIKKMVRASPAAAVDFPQTLSATGCVDPADPFVPAPGLIPYGPNAPFWSDGADKERFMALPDGESVVLDADGDFEFPVGTVLVKNFDYAGRRVETRLFVRHDDGDWGGYSYAWNDAATDATLLASSLVRDLGGGKSWTYPSRSECFQCHTQAAGYSLGLEAGQLNAPFVYEATNRLSNQMATFDHIGVFGGPVGDVTGLPVYARPTGPEVDPAATLEERARAYLHTNCAGCHRPGGPARGSMDLRHATSLSQTGTCNVAPQLGTLGIADAKLVAPGEPGRSVLLSRLKSTGANQMPPLGVHVLDTEGVALIDAWIDSLSGCP